MQQKIIILTAPSGSGKSSIAKGLMQAMPQLQFSVSATTRQARANEIDGEHYHFISIADFENKIANNQFAEWEKVYEGKYYGTLKSEIENIWNQNKIPLLDIDVKGAQQIHQIYPTQTCSIYIKVSITDLQKRLLARNTETPESLQERISKAALEAKQQNLFNHIVVNENLQLATTQTINIVEGFLGEKI